MGRKHEGTVTVRPDGLVMFRVMVNGRRITTYGKTEKEARAKAAERLPLIGDTATGVKFSQLVEAWKQYGPEKHGLAPTTFDQYHYLIKARVSPLIDNRILESLTAKEMAKVIRQQEGSASTVRSVYAGLVHLFDFAVGQDLVAVNVMRDVKRPKSAPSKRRDISQEEAIRILKAAQGHRWEVAVWLGLGAGLRRGEMLGLRWSDVDFNSGFAHVTGNVTRSSAGLRRGDPKTQRGKRRVPLPDEVVSALRVHRRKQTEERLKAGSAWQDSDLVLTTEAGGMAEPRQLSRVWSGFASKAKVSDRGTHVGRHFAATTLLASGKASVADVAAMLGHDPAVLLNTYAAAVADGQRSAASVLGSALSVAE